MDEPGMKAGTLRPQMPVGPPRRHHRDLDVVDVFVEFLEFSLHRFGVLPSMGHVAGGAMRTRGKRGSGELVALDVESSRLPLCGVAALI
jgi:hypothetical protein